MGNFTNLKNNPVFQLSLASKELFHSNFLYWLATDSQTFNLFCDILKQMGAVGTANNLKQNPGNYVICREKNHFDFSIWEISGTRTPEEDIENSESSTEDEDTVYSNTHAILGNVVFVLENKFKSIPDKDQLDDYAAQVFKINTPTNYKSSRSNLKIKSDSQENVRKIYDNWKGTISTNNNKKVGKIISQTLKCDFVLLTLANKFSHRSSIASEGLWGIVEYSKYASNLKMSMPLVLPGFSNDLIQQYQDFIDNFSNQIGNDLQKVKYSKDIFDVDTSTIAGSYGNIRMHDIWQKLFVSSEIDNLIPQLRKQFSQKNINLMAEDTFIFQGKIRKRKNVQPPIKYVDIFIGLGYGTSGASLNIKYKLDDEFAFIIEIQGNNYRRGILYYKGANSPATIADNVYNYAISKFPLLGDFFCNSNASSLPTFPYNQRLQSYGHRDIKRNLWGNYGAKAGSKVHMIYQTIQLSGIVKQNGASTTRNVSIADLESAIVYDMQELIKRYP